MANQSFSSLNYTIKYLLNSQNIVSDNMNILFIYYIFLWIVFSEMNRPYKFQAMIYILMWGECICEKIMVQIGMQ